jgi:hypothetical protein
MLNMLAHPLILWFQMCAKKWVGVYEKCKEYDIFCGNVLILDKILG